MFIYICPGLLCIRPFTHVNTLVIFQSMNFPWAWLIIVTKLFIEKLENVCLLKGSQLKTLAECRQGRHPLH